MHIIVIIGDGQLSDSLIEPSQVLCDKDKTTLLLTHPALEL